MPLTGTIGENYEIVSLLGAGAMGEVYRAVDRKIFGRTVAVKVLSERLTGSEEGRVRFRREMETAARLHHPGIVTIFDWGEHQGRDYFVMEFLDGRDLHGILRSGVPWTLEQKLGVAKQIADALDFAHAAGVIHRDIKPGNIMIVDRGGEPQVKLVDFGIVHVERSSLTQTQSHPGTFSYMSPEQLRNEPLDPRSDLFSLGIVFYELFAGAHPFHAQSEAVISSRILLEAAKPPTSFDPDLPSECERLLLAMLEKDPAQRPASAHEVSESLRAILRHVVSRSSGTDPADYARLDDLNRQLIENLVGWARQKEGAGQLDDALAAYEKALQLAPDSERFRRKVPELKLRIETRRELAASLRDARERLASGRVDDAREAWKRAWVLAPHDDEVQALEREIAEAEKATAGDRERREFVAERIRAAEAQLEAGSLDAARPPLVEVLLRYPDDTEAAAILDQLMHAAAEGIPYGDYRVRLRAAREALEAEAFDRARAACAEARALWPAGPDVEPVERVIAEREEDSRRREAEKQKEREQEERERERRRMELLDRYLESARTLLAAARRARSAPEADPAAVYADFEQADRAIDLVVAEDAGHAEAARLRAEVRAEMEALRAEADAKARAKAEAEQRAADEKAEREKRAAQAKADEERRVAEETAEQERRAAEAKAERERQAAAARALEQAAAARRKSEEAEKADAERRAAAARAAEAAKASKAADAARRKAEGEARAEAEERAAADRKAAAAARKKPAPPRPREQAEPKGGRAGLWIGLGAAAVVIVAVAAVFALRGGGETPAPAPPPAPSAPARPGMAALDVFPWGRVDEVVDVERGTAVASAAGKETPVILELPEGRYRASFRNAAFTGPVQLEFTVASGATTKVSGKFPEADATSMLADLERAAGRGKR